MNNGNGVCTFDDATHVYRIDGVIVPSVTQVLRLGGVEPSFPNVPEAIREAARQKGTYVHEACALYDTGQLDWDHLRAEAAPLVPYVEAWAKWRGREGARHPLDGIEESVWSKTLGVAGTLDRRIGGWGGDPCTILDLKTSKKLTWTFGVQLAGYAVLYLLREGVALGDPMREAFAAVRRKIIQLGADGTLHIEPYDNADDLDVFVAALTITRAKQAHHPRLKLPNGEEE